MGGHKDVAQTTHPEKLRAPRKMMSRKVAIVTGGTGRIAEFICLGLAKAGYKVVLVARDRVKLKARVLKLKQITRSKAITYRICDVANHASIFKMAAAWKGSLHVLVNNAAVTPPERLETLEGIELQWATNVMGYYWMLEAFGPVLWSTAGSRVVNMTSSYAGGLMMGDPQFLYRPYSVDAAYRASKQAVRILTGCFSRRKDWSAVRINSCHPGVCTSATSMGLGFDLDPTDNGAKHCAETPLYLALDKGVTTSGGYYSTYRRESCRWSKNSKLGNALLEACAKLTPTPIS